MLVEPNHRTKKLMLQKMFLRIKVTSTFTVYT